MSVENIKAFSIIGHKKALDDVCVTLGQSKVFQPDEVSNFYNDMVGFDRATAQNAFSEIVLRFFDIMKILSINPRCIPTQKDFLPRLTTLKFTPKRFWRRYRLGKNSVSL